MSRNVYFGRSSGFLWDIALKETTRKLDVEGATERF
jgi:hypothetical protein